MQYLYTLASTRSDSYYEQFLLSITSLKARMPNAFITLLCDTHTKADLTGNRREYEKIVSNIITAEVPSSLTQVEISRWIKTSMRRLVKGDFLFIDCDTIITDDLSSIFSSNLVFAACLDKHSILDNHNKKHMIIKNDNKLGFSSYMSNKHFNSGVIYCADTPQTHTAFDRWHELWLYSKDKNILRDQPSFNMAIQENISHFTELNGTWNCQIAYNGLPYLSNARIIHYFATDMIFNESPYLLSCNYILMQIKEKGIIPDEAFDLLKEPKTAFTPHSQILAGDDMLYVINSSLFQFIFILRKKMPSIFNIFNRLCAALKRPVKNKYIKKNKKNIYN